MTSGHFDQKSKQIAEELNVSEKTVRNDTNFAASVEELDKIGIIKKTDVRQGKNIFSKHAGIIDV